jgi:hypothetical protein
MKILFRPKSFWIGLHYSDLFNKYCLNILPMITITWSGNRGKFLENEYNKLTNKAKWINHRYNRDRLI